MIKQKRPAVSIVGTGALGSVLARALHQSGEPIKSLFNRHENKAKILADELNVEYFGTLPADANQFGRVLFLTVCDQKIRSVAQKLAALSLNFNEMLIIHCSGSLSSACLQPLRKKGAQAAVFHPIQTFSSASGPDDFSHIYADIEGDEMGLRYLENLCSKLECEVIRISSEAKSYLHGAAVTASNYLIALIENATQIAVLGGVKKDQALKALIPLMNQTLKNVSAVSAPADALSGPIRRGDAQTVKNHLDLLQSNHHLASVYAVLGRSLVEIADEKHFITPKQAKQLMRVLEPTG